MRTTIGVEEEFVLLDPVTLSPVGQAQEALAQLQRAELSGAVMPEFFASQLEFATSVCETSADILAALEGFRAELSAWASTTGVLAAGVGLPFHVRETPHITKQQRYQEIASHFGLVVSDHQVNGLHVHVGVVDRDAAIIASNRLRPWLPTLLALSANSPYWRGVDTGYDSWRAIHSRRWTTHGVPPAFRNAADYDRRTAALRGIGGTTDSGTLNWVIRPSDLYPTVEVRVFDAQLDADTSAALAGIVRGLISSAEEQNAVELVEPEALDSAFWHAARNGVSAELVDPHSQRLRSAAEVANELLRQASAGLTEHDDAQLAGRAVDRILRLGNGATQQRRAIERGGIAALAELIRIPTK